MSDQNTSETSLLISRSGVPYTKPDNRRPYQKQLAIYFILASTALERLAFYSLLINLVIILQSDELSWDPGNSITVSFIFSGISYISTLIFATVSDAKLGRAKTIIIGFCLYLIGYVFIILITNTDTRVSLCAKLVESNNTNISSLKNEYCFGPIIGTLIFTAIGIGAIQANMAVFGAEQMQESNQPARYFDKYIVAVNIGGIFATLLVSYIQDFKNDPNRYFHGYLFAASSLVGAILLFIMGKRFYIHINPHDTIITKYIPVIINAFQTWWKYKDNKDIKTNMRTNSSTVNILFESTSSDKDRWAPNGENLPSFLDYARVRNNGKFIDRLVDDVKSLQRVIIVFLLLIPYWLIYSQIQTTFLLQGQHMRIPNIANHPPTQMPAIWMTVGDQISIFIGILILNLFVYKHLITRNQSNLIQAKFIIGMILASITMFIAGTVEKFRQDDCYHDNRNSNLSIFIQLPQYIVMGISEVFGMVASFEFAYLAAPRSAQSLIMSLRFFSLGLSSFIGEGYVRIFTKANEQFEFACRHHKHILYIYFYVLGGIQLLAIVIFILCNRKFGILQLNPHKINTKQFR